jgi:hypothetical protein
MTDTPGLRPTPAPFRRSREAAEREARYTALEKATRTYARAGGPFNPAGGLGGGALLLAASAALLAGSLLGSAALAFAAMPAALLTSHAALHRYQRLGVVVPEPEEGSRRGPLVQRLHLVVNLFFIVASLATQVAFTWSGLSAGASAAQNALSTIALAGAVGTAVTVWWVRGVDAARTVGFLLFYLYLYQGFRDLLVSGHPPTLAGHFLLPLMGIGFIVAGALAHRAHRRAERRLLELSRSHIAGVEAPPR